jgi:membrane-bound lytic murein transglycosylase D
MLTDLKPLRLAILLSLLAAGATGCATIGELESDETSSDEMAMTTDSGDLGSRRVVTKKTLQNRPKVNKSASKPKSTNLAGGTGPVDEDLWQRIRQGLKLDVPDNPRLEQARRWLDAHPQYLVRLAENAEPFIYLVTEQVEQRDMPLELALLPVIESAYNPSATSPKNAAGIWQFMPGTARAMGLKQDHWYDGRRDVVASTDAALGYLQLLWERFDGDWPLALAAYNAGEGTIRKAIERNARAGKPTDFWSLDLPTETEHYVPQLLAVSEAIAKATRRSEPLPLIRNEPRLAAIEMPAQIDISTTSNTCAVPESAIKHYNPALRRGTTSPDGPHRILLPIDDAASCEQALMASLAPEGRRGWTRHLQIDAQVVAQAPSRHGDDALATFSAPTAGPSAETPPSIAGDAGGHEILAQAPAADTLLPTHPPAADDFVIESRRAPSKATRADRGDEPRLTAHIPTKPAPQGTIVRVKGEPKAPPPQEHEVRNGDTLYSIARRYQVDVDDLKSWNKLKGDRVVSGQAISVQKGSGLRRL